MADADASESTGGKRKRRGGSRRKTGCETCKKRHIRCDERIPQCGNCERLNLDCRASDFIAQSIWEPVKSGQLKKTQGRDQPRPAEKATDAAIVTLQSTSSGSPVVEQANGSTSIGTLSASRFDTPLSLTEENVYLLTSYRSGVATWMDVFDEGKTYQEDVTKIGTTCPLLLRCICAFTAKHLSLRPSGAIWEPIASRYYVEALNLLIREIDCSAPTANSLTAAMLLSSYEVMAALSVPHRSHTKGALDLIRARNVSARSPGSDGKNFRIYVRHELVVALINESPLQLGPEDWQMPVLEARPPDDQLAMHTMWLAGKSINLIFDGELSTNREDLTRSLHAWYDLCPPTFRGTQYGEIDDEGLQKMFFAVPAAAAAILWYHLSCILLYAERCDDASFQPKLAHDHAKAILGICASDLPDCVRCFAITPLYIAGKHVDNITMKFRSWSLLADIERELGYHTDAMVKVLKDMVH